MLKYIYFIGKGCATALLVTQVGVGRQSLHRKWLVRTLIIYNNNSTSEIVITNVILN